MMVGMPHHGMHVSTGDAAPVGLPAMMGGWQRAATVALEVKTSTLCTCTFRCDDVTGVASDHTKRCMLRWEHRRSAYGQIL